MKSTMDVHSGGVQWRFTTEVNKKGEGEGAQWRWTMEVNSGGAQLRCTVEVQI